MKLAGFNFTKISVEKKKDNFKDLKLETKIDIEDVKEIKSNFLKSKDLFLTVKFAYDILYSPGIADLNFKGNILLAVDSKQAKEVLRDWKEKKISEEFRLIVFNLILKKSTIKALQAEEELNLPTHFRLPSINGQAPEQSEKK
jgi:hypothetical protein